jgi:hypothetical protein
MSDYKRLVSYIYSYPGGVRDKNVGFAKAEVRNDQFKLGVSLKGVYTDAPETYGVYFLVERDKDNTGRFSLLKIGNIIVNAGMGQYSDLLNPNNINKSEFCFDDLSGIAIAKQDSRFYMMFSLWEDCEVNPSAIRFLPEGYKKPKGGEVKLVGQMTEGVPVVSENDSIEIEKDSNIKDENVDQITEPGEVELVEIESSEDSVQRVDARRGEPDSEMEPPDGNASFGKAEVLRNISSNEPILDAIEESSDNLLEDIVDKELEEALEEEETPKPNVMPEYVTRNINTILNRQRFQGMESEKDTMYDLENQVKASSVGSRTKMPVNGFDKLFINADYIDAFDDDYFYNCIEVTPDILKTLPIGDDAVINNSFLIHGFYNFKHVLFGRVRENDNDTRYFIGVPGMYCNRERYMASMFGFNSFKKSHRSDYNNPYFGYWYHEI